VFGYGPALGLGTPVQDGADQKITSPRLVSEQGSMESFSMGLNVQGQVFSK
jgi:hypothetical protein